MKRIYTVVVYVVWMTSVWAAGGLQWEPGTLLMAGFDEEDVTRADYANGWPEFGGGGYEVVEGVRGKAVDLRGVVVAEDFWKMENAYLPHFTQWVIWPRGNVSFDQGTYEFWFKVGSGKDKRPVVGNGELLHFQSYQPLRPRIRGRENEIVEGEEYEEAREAGNIRHIQPHLRLTRSKFSWLLVSVSGEVVEGDIDFRKIPGFMRELDPEEWHHFAMQWGWNGVEFYLDGKKLGHSEFKDGYGLALTGPTQRGLSMGGIIMDELRIMAFPYYKENFEPAWPGGERPGYAFNVTSKAGDFVLKADLDVMPRNSTAAGEGMEKVTIGEWELGIAKNTGQLTVLKSGENAFAERVGGLRLWNGYARDEKAAPRLTDWFQESEAIYLKQDWGNGIEVDHHIRPGQKGQLEWKVKLHNNSKDNKWLEALMELPIGNAGGEAIQKFFDMSWEQDQVQHPRRRDEYIFSLPFVAVWDGENAWGVGMDPRDGASALIGEWLPGEQALIRQGTRVALRPEETRTINFVVLAGSGEFGAVDLVDQYHGYYPELYRLKAEVPIYSYLGVCQYFSYVHIPDLTRQYYSGGQWGHGPYHTKGDYLGDSRLWGRKDLEGRADYEHALGNQKRYKTPDGLKAEVVKRSREAFYNHYTLRRSHDVPNLTARFIIDEFMPGVKFPDDPLSAGQYFAPKNYVVNEYRTPLGHKFMNDQAETMRLIGRYSPGFINDFSQSSSMRLIDDWARKSEGRAFAPDRGEYLVAAFGHMERYRMINSFLDAGNAQSMISDWGLISYMLSGYSAANTFESGDPFIATTGMREGLKASRFLLGHKPTSVLTSYGLDNIGVGFSVDEFSPERLRDYYRYSFRRLMLAAIETGYYADPPLLHGKQWNVEVNPLLVESLVTGRRIVSGVKHSNEVWVVRGGEKDASVLIVGNESAEEKQSDLELRNGYLGGSYLWADYFGENLLKQVLTTEQTTVKGVAVLAHDVRGMRPVMEFDTEGEVLADVTWAGDGLTIGVHAEIEAKSGGRLRAVLPNVLYEVVRIRINGEEVQPGAGEWVEFAAGKGTIEMEMRNKVLAFDKVAWEKISWVQEGQPGFVLLTDGSEFSRGTAQHFIDWTIQVDEEDGVAGNMSDPEVFENEIPDSAIKDRWVVDLRGEVSGEVLPETGVRIDGEKKYLHLVGATAGEVRRGAVVLLRLMDRSVHKVGRHVPLEKNLRGGWMKPGWNSPYDEKEPAWKRLYTRRTKTLEFFQNFSDPDFLSKPILEKEYEPVYANGNVDFFGKYKLRYAPYLFEPTFEEDYVYGSTESMSSIK